MTLDQKIEESKKKAEVFDATLLRVREDYKSSGRHSKDVEKLLLECEERSKSTSVILAFLAFCR